MLYNISLYLIMTSVLKPKFQYHHHQKKNKKLDVIVLKIKFTYHKTQSFKVHNCVGFTLE